VQEPDPLGRELRIRGGDARDVGARTIEAGDEAEFDRIGPDAEHNRNCGGRGLGGNCRWRAARRDDRGHPATDQLSRQFGKPGIVVVRETEFDRYVAALGETGLAEAFAKCCDNPRAQLRHARVKKSNDWNR